MKTQFVITVSFLLVQLCHVGSACSQRVPPQSFDTAAAMQSMFGSYDPGTHTSTWTVPDEKNIDLAGSSFHPGDKTLVRSFWKSSYQEGGVKKFALLTYAVPLDKDWKPLFPGDNPFSCHACSPLVGAAIFMWTGMRWDLEASQANATRLGAWGEPPDIVRLLKIGPDRTGIEITELDSGQGTTTESEHVLALSGSTISDVLDVLIAEDNKGGCEPHRPSDEPACYHYRKSVTYLRSRNSDYYDMVFTLNGTDYGEDPQRVRHISGTEKLHFSEGRFGSIFRRGSITSTERAISSTSANAPQGGEFRLRRSRWSIF